MQTQSRQKQGEKGFTLIEILIAVTIFTIILIAALLMYDRSTGVFKRGVEAADAQQNTRVAFDRMVADLRMAGFDYDRDGFPSGAAGTTWAAGRAYGLNVIVVPTTANGFNYRATTAGTSHATTEPTWPTTIGDTVNDNGIVWETVAGSSQAQQPDEQIEYAGPSAITIRANLDFESDVANDNGREPDYENAQFPVVTTGNDEIVTYALRSQDSTKNVNSVTFFADVNASGTPARTAHPGGTAERLVTISNVDLTNANPPYTLIRFTLADDGSVVESPLAENIRSLNFLYFQDIQGVTPLRDLSETARPDGATILGTGQYDPDSPGLLVAGRSVRSRIKSIRMNLVGMNDQPDPAFTDPDETIASAVPYRKYRLETLIVPRNIGKRGLREQDTTPPGTPTISDVWFGHCGIAKVEWQAPASGGPVEQYTVLYDNDGDPSDGYAYLMQVGTSLQAYVPVHPHAEGTWHTTPWQFVVQAVSSFGNGPQSAPIAGTPLNRTRPMPITGLTTTAGTNNIVLTWQRPDDNVSGMDDIIATPSGSVDTEGITVAKEELRYEIYRDFTDTFTPNAGNRIWDGGTGPGAPVTINATGQVTFTDKTAVNCYTYYYRVRVMDICGAPATGMTVGGRTGIGDYFPVVGDAGIMGTNPGTGLAPEAPSNLTIENTSTCDGTNCTINLTWPPVTADTNSDPAAIRRYVIRRQQKLGAANVGVPVDSTITVTDPTADPVTASQVVPDPAASGGTFDKYEYVVMAELCSIQSAPSPARTYPCAFSGGIPTINASSVIDGSGSSGNPYLVFGSSNLTVSGLTGAATSVTATLYKDATVVAGPGSYTISAGSAVVPLGDPDDDGAVYRAELSIQYTGGCVITRTVYYAGSATNCCLVL